MKNRLGIHPKEYALGQTEKYYADMSQKGWELVSRGATFSRFRKTEPKKMRYRVEVVAPKLLVNGSLPEEQVGVYADCGWEYVTGSGYIHVFRSPEGSDAPEFYLEPEQQAATLKCLRKDQTISLLLPLAELILAVILSSALWSFTTGHWAAQLYAAWIENTGLMLAFGLLLLRLMAGQLWGAWYLKRLCGKMKKGIALDYAPKSRGIFTRTVSGAVLLAILACLVGDYISYTPYPMPVSTEEPYVLLSELGIQGERMPNHVNGEESRVKYHRSFLAQCWYGQEFLHNQDKEDWLYQKVYLLKDSRMASRLAEALMLNSTFSQSKEAFTPVEIPGLDEAYITEGLECIAVKGNRVAIFTHIWNTQEEMVESLKQISEKWN